jgi:hypothetical protein
MADRPGQDKVGIYLPGYVQEVHEGSHLFGLRALSTSVIYRKIGKKG